MADQPFTPMHAVDTVSNATEAAFGAVENRIARLEQLVADTNKQIARTFAGLLRDLETAPVANEARQSGNGDPGTGGDGDASDPIEVLVEGKALDPKADKPRDPANRRHRWI
jgi:hypothetical protein